SIPASKSVSCLKRSTKIRSNWPLTAYPSGTSSLLDFASSRGVVALVTSVRVCWPKSTAQQVAISDRTKTELNFFMGVPVVRCANFKQLRPPFIIAERLHQSSPGHRKKEARLGQRACRPSVETKGEAIVAGAIMSGQ